MNFETRRKLSHAAKQQCMEANGKIMEDVLKLRQRVADIMDFDCYAAYSLDWNTMAKTPQNVKKLLDDVRTRLVEGGKKDLEELLQLKKQEGKKNFLFFFLSF